MVRSYRSEDLPWVVETANKAWRGINAAYRRAYGDELFARLVPDEHTRKGEEMRRICVEHPEDVFVCEENGRQAGFVHLLLDRERRIGEIGNNAVHPECGFKGIGQQMYRFAFDRFRAEGMEYAMVQTGLDEGHAPARRAYERAGFDISHSKITYYKKL
jgi:ribosomal protein S18 acetylase RimI-like enzyme